MGAIGGAALALGKTALTIAKAHPLITGVVAGGAAAGTSAINAIRENRAQEQALGLAKQQAQQVSALQAQQASQAARQADLQANAIQESVRRRQELFSSLTKPTAAPDTTPLKGLATIATSPLGDPSDPNLGKRKLLGN